jgi:2-polyprenyl-6-methoxyphenol hydroxylase-like FAD-dependent oxidoreductase
MTLPLADVKRIAEDVARQEDPALEVVEATTAEGGAAYIEVTVTIHGCRREPCRLVIGADRGGGESVLRSAIASRLREHLEQHREALAAE